MKKRLNKDPIQLGGLIADFLKKNGVDAILKEQEIIDSWRQIVGDTIADNTVPKEVVNKILFVKANSASWRNELIYLKADIIKQINIFTQKKIIKDIMFK